MSGEHYFHYTDDKIMCPKKYTPKGQKGVAGMGIS
jgi:hypothetical protein